MFARQLLLPPDHLSYSTSPFLGMGFFEIESQELFAQAWL
jgi:hypothetical protein